MEEGAGLVWCQEHILPMERHRMHSIPWTKEEGMRGCCGPKRKAEEMPWTEEEGTVQGDDPLGGTGFGNGFLGLSGKHGSQKEKQMHI